MWKKNEKCEDIIDFIIELYLINSEKTLKINKELRCNLYFITDFKSMENGI